MFDKGESEARSRIGSVIERVASEGSTPKVIPTQGDNVAGVLTLAGMWWHLRPGNQVRSLEVSRGSANTARSLLVHLLPRGFPVTHSRPPKKKAPTAAMRGGTVGAGRLEADD